MHDILAMPDRRVWREKLAAWSSGFRAMVESPQTSVGSCSRHRRASRRVAGIAGMFGLVLRDDRDGTAAHVRLFMDQPRC